MKRKGCSIIFINDRQEVLLFLRDDKPDIPYPNQWDVPGGHVEEGETPEQCIVREMQEEMGLDLQGFHRFSVIEFEDREEFTFWKRANLEIGQIQLNEGQYLRWFTADEVRNTELACGFNQILNEFFRDRPFISPSA